MNSDRKTKIPYFSMLILVALLTTASLLTACSSGDSAADTEIQMAPMSQMPMAMQQAPVTVREAYQFAVANPDAVKNVPCYCGCGAVGHTSNYSCYVDEAASSSTTVFDQHALGCSICVDITQDVMKMTREGKSPQEIRAAIDATYSKYGPSNMPAVQ